MWIFKEDQLDDSKKNTKISSAVSPKDKLQFPKANDMIQTWFLSATDNRFYLASLTETTNDKHQIYDKEPKVQCAEDMGGGKDLNTCQKIMAILIYIFRETALYCQHSRHLLHEGYCTQSSFFYATFFIPWYFRSINIKSSLQQFSHR